MNFFRRIYSFDYMGHKKWWFTISAIIIVAGLISLFVKGGGNPVKGLNYGLEFKEGTRISVAFDKQATLAEVRKTVAAAGLCGRSASGDAERRRQRLRGVPDPDAGACRRREQGELKTALNDRFTITSSRTARRSGTSRRWAPRSAARW